MMDFLFSIKHKQAFRVGVSIFAMIFLALLHARPIDKNKEFLTGYILDAQTKAPLVGASIRTMSNDKLYFTNQMGQFFLPVKEVSEVEISITYLGYEEQILSFSSAPSKPSALIIKLKPMAIDLSEVTISAQPTKNLQQLNSLDLHLRPLRSAQDMLRLVPGLFVAQHAGGGKAEQIFLRGFDIDHGTDINLSVDGMPVNMVSHAHGQGYSDLHFLIPETVAKINFDKGPYHADKGNFTTAGFVGFQTKNTLEQNQVKLEAGQFGTFRGLAMLDLAPESSQHDAYLAAEYLLSDGYFDASQNFNRVNLFAKYSGAISEKAMLKASLSSFSSAWDASGQIPARAVDQGQISRLGAIDSTEGGSTLRQNLNVQLFNSLSENSSFETQLFYSRYDFELFSNFTFFLEDPVNGDQILQKENRQILGNNSKYQFRKDFGNNLSGVSTIGFSFRADQVDDIGLFQTKNRTDILDTLASGDLQEINAAFFLSQNLKIGKRFELEAGLRYDQFRFAYQDHRTKSYDPVSLGKGIFSPNVKLSFDFNPKYKAYLNLGRGFHSNDSRTILEEQGPMILPKAYGFDLGFYLKPIDRLLVQTAFWFLDLEQEFVYVGDAGIVEPSGQSQRLGIDLSLRYQLGEFLFLNSDFSFSKARFTEGVDGENFIPLAAPFSSQGGLTFRMTKGLTASLQYRILADRPANEDFSLVAEGYQLLDAVIQYKSKQFQVALSAENILNSDWKEAQFETTSRLAGEPAPSSEIHFTPGSPLFAKLSFSFFW